MEKEDIGSVNVNFMLVAYVGIVSHHHLTLSLHKTKTLENILATK